jgi:hypothetical protein
MADLAPGETILLEGRAGCETAFNRGWLTLTNRRIVWERRLSIDPFGHHEVSFDLSKVRSARSDGDTIVLDVDGEEIFLFVQWWLLSLVTSDRKTKEWLNEIQRAMEEAKVEAS